MKNIFLKKKMTVLLINQGDPVPADVILLHTSNVKGQVYVGN